VAYFVGARASGLDGEASAGAESCAGKRWSRGLLLVGTPLAQMAAAFALLFDALIGLALQLMSLLLALATLAQIGRLHDWLLLGRPAPGMDKCCGGGAAANAGTGARTVAVAGAGASTAAGTSTGSASRAGAGIGACAAAAADRAARAGRSAQDAVSSAI